MKRTFTALLAAWLLLLVFPESVRSQEITPFERTVCRIARDLEVNLATSTWRGCLAGALGGAGGACFTCLFLSGPLAVTCTIVCGTLLFVGAAVIITCWFTFQEGLRAAERNHTRCLDGAMFACI